MIKYKLGYKLEIRHNESSNHKIEMSLIVADASEKSKIKYKFVFVDHINT